MMILCYLPQNTSDDEKHQRIDYLIDKYQMFFLSEEDIITSTETNQKSLRLILKKSHISLFWIKSLEEIPFTPTQISELILFCINNGIDFHSESDNLCFTKKDFNIVYPTIFEEFRKLVKREYIFSITLLYIYYTLFEKKIINVS